LRSRAAPDEASEQLRPERLGLGFSDVQADDLAPLGLVDGVGDHDAFALHPAAIADLLIEQPGDPADLRLGDP
jgi:hypothetical protein